MNDRSGGNLTRNLAPPPSGEGAPWGFVISPRQVTRLLAIAGIAAAIAGTVTGTFLVVEDEAWPARGGYEAILQLSTMFTIYALVVTVPLGFALSVTLSPLMRRFGAAEHLVMGAVIGAAAHLLVDLAIAERVDGLEDFLGGALAGIAAGLLWWFSNRRLQTEARAHG